MPVAARHIQQQYAGNRGPCFYPAKGRKVRASVARTSGESMTRLLGIDLGTSSVKAVIIDEKARLLAVGSRDYPIDVPQPGYAEQDPAVWWKASVQAIRQAVEQAGSAEIDAIGLSGQMHGTILMDEANKPIGPAIIWADQRSAAEVDEIVSLVGTDQLARIAGTAPATGFMGPTFPCLQKHNPAPLDRTP